MFSKCLHNFCCLQSCKIIQPYVESQTSPFLDACYLWGGNCNALHPRSQPPPRKRDEVTPGLTWVNDAHRWCPTTVSKRISLEQLRVRDRVDATQTSPPRSLKFCACVYVNAWRHYARISWCIIRILPNVAEVYSPVLSSTLPPTHMMIKQKQIPTIGTALKLSATIRYSTYYATHQIYQHDHNWCLRKVTYQRAHCND